MSFEPQNPLEMSLMKAMVDPGHRPQFYRDLLESEIFFIRSTPSPPREQGRRVVPPGETFKVAVIELGGKPCIPIFTSLVRLQAVLPGPAEYVGIGARAFLEMTLGSELFLNPGSEFGKDITPREAAALLDGSLWQLIESKATQKATRAMLGEPARRPDELLTALASLFKEKKHVNRAWNAMQHIPDRHEKPHTLIAIDCSGDFDALLADAGIVVANVTVSDPPVVFIRVVSDGDFWGQYFRDKKPFYVH